MIFEGVKSLLFIENSMFDSMARTIIDNFSWNFLYPVILTGLVVEHITNMNYKEIIMRSFIAIITLLYFGTIHKTCVDYSFKFSNTLISKQNQTNFLKLMKKAKVKTKRETTAKKASEWEIMKYMSKFLLDDMPSFFIWVFTTLALIVLKQFYSLVYHFSYVLVGVASLLSIIPITRNSLNGIFKSSLWCILMPIIVSLVLCLVGNIIANEVSNNGHLVNSFEGLIQLAIVAIMLLMTPLITIKLMDGQGLSHVAERVSSMAAMSAMLALPSVAKNKARHYLPQLTRGFINNADRYVGNASQGIKNGIGHGISSGKSLLGGKAEQIYNKNGMNPSISSFADSSNPFKDHYKSGFKKASLGEKGIVLADGLFNHKANMEGRNISTALAHEAISGAKAQTNGKYANTTLSRKTPLTDVSRLGRITSGNNASTVSPSTVSTLSSVSPKTKDFLGQNSDMKDKVFSSNKKRWNELLPQDRKKIAKDFNIRGTPKDGTIYFRKNLGIRPSKEKDFLRNREQITSYISKVDSHQG